MIVSNPKPLTGNHLSGDKHTGTGSAIFFYKLENGDNSDSGNKAIIWVKNYKALTGTKQNTKKRTFPVIKYFDYQGPKVIWVLREMTVSVFEHLGITTWKGIYQRWMFIEQVIK